MEFMGLSDLTWIGIIATVICVVVGILQVKTKKPKVISFSKDNTKYKDIEKYAVKGGMYIIYLGIGFAVMVAISFLNVLVSNILGLIGMGVFGYFWKKMYDEFGPV